MSSLTVYFLCQQNNFHWSIQNAEERNFWEQELHPSSESLTADLFVSKTEPYEREPFSSPTIFSAGSVPALCLQPCTLSTRLARILNCEEEKEKQTTFLSLLQPPNTVSHCKLFNYLFLRCHIVLFKLSYLVHRYFNDSCRITFRSDMSAPAYLQLIMLYGKFKFHLRYHCSTC